jgi:signal transduction histidine kinase
MISVRLASEPAVRLSPAVSIAHDLRNPLATIHGGAEMLVSSMLSQTQARRIARNIYCASVRMGELLEEFLDQSRDQTRSAERERELSDVHELITRAVDRIAVTAELQAVRIVCVVPVGLSIMLDRHRIHRVLVNLLVNALEAMPHGGSIHISAVSDRHSVLIRVRDSGPGIAPGIRDRLFQPFATAGKANGIGLGLAFSRQTVLDHGGEIWVESPLEGACFAVRLPFTPGPHPVSSGRSTPNHKLNWPERPARGSISP